MGKKKRWTDAEILKRYSTPGLPAALSHAAKLAREIRVPVARVRKVLSAHPKLALHSRTVKKFRRRSTTTAVFAQLSVDLKDLSGLAEHNDNFKWLLIAIDIGSRYVYCRPLKSKHASAVIDAFRDIFGEIKRSRVRKLPRTIQADKGREFDNGAFRKFLAGYGVDIFYVTNSETKASIAERSIATIVGALFKHLTLQHTHRYIDHLQATVKSYNTSVHSTIGMAPASVRVWHGPEIWERVHNKQTHRLPEAPRYSVGAYVFVVKQNKIFRKSYKTRFTGEIFKIAEAWPTDPPTYVLEDLAGERVKGTFYRQELALTTLPDYYEIDRVLDTRIRNKRKEYLVTWQNYPATMQNWVTDLKPI